MFESHPEPLKKLNPSDTSEQYLTNREVCGLLRELFTGYADGPLEFADAYRRMGEACGDKAQNYLNVIDVLGGVLTSWMAAQSVQYQQDFGMVVESIFNDDYASMLDELLEIDGEVESNVANSTESLTGEDSSDGVVGDGQVDGLE